MCRSAVSSASSNPHGQFYPLPTPLGAATLPQLGFPIWCHAPSHCCPLPDPEDRHLIRGISSLSSLLWTQCR